jgi:hypothetical protein
MFCDKLVKYKPSSREKEKLVKCETDCATESIKEAAKYRNDFAMIGCIADVNLAAREARYHESCRRSYLRTDDRKHHAAFVAEETIGLNDVRIAHDEAFTFICSFVTEELIENRKVLRMTMLRTKYLDYIKLKYPDQYNDSYQTQLLKRKLVNHFGPKLSFWLPAVRCKSELVFSSQIDVGEALDIAFESVTSDTRILEKAAAIINSQIIKEHQQSPEMPWPPSASTLKSNIVSPPRSVVYFFEQAISGKKVFVTATECTDWQILWLKIFVRQLHEVVGPCQSTFS